MEGKKDKFGCVTHREFRTGGGQLLNIMCPPEEADSVKAALENIKELEIKIPRTKRIKQLDESEYGEETRYDIVQLCKCGSFLEVLQILDPPDSRCGNILLAYLSSVDQGKTFFEFDTIENASSAFDKLKTTWKKTAEEVLKMPGCFRAVACGILDPWFYAVADQSLRGDVVFPDRIKEDEFFRFGKRYVVKDFQELVFIKTCIGAEEMTYEPSYSGKKTKCRRVFWSDGTFADYWENNRNNWPKPLDESNLWIQEVMGQFRELLNGIRKNFEILFRDGSKFVGQWKPKSPKDKTDAGWYGVSLVFENGEKAEDTFKFEPTKEIPTVIALLEKAAEKKGFKIKEIYSLAKKSSVFGKKWAGVY